jgi:hypothetical protein
MFNDTCNHSAGVRPIVGILFELINSLAVFIGFIAALYMMSEFYFKMPRSVCDAFTQKAHTVIYGPYPPPDYTPAHGLPGGSAFADTDFTK